MNLRDLLAPEFLSQFDACPFATWLRLEPRCRADNFAPGLDARIADPAWMLARQWQVGEFEAEDAEFPYQATVHAQRASMVLPYPLEDGQSGYSPPLEATVEKQPVDVSRWRQRVHFGQQFERLLLDWAAQAPEAEQKTAAASKLIASYRSTTYAVKRDGTVTDAATERFLQLMAGRAIDGQSMLSAAMSDSLSPGDSGVNQDALNGVGRRLCDWFRGAFLAGNKTGATWNSQAPESIWQPEKLSYAFNITLQAPSDKFILDAPDYRNGDLDWYTFTAQRPKDDDKLWTEDVQDYVPTRVSFAGMPNARWWMFEDGRTDFGNLDVDKPDLAKMALMQFAFAYGDDWFIVPFDVKMGDAVAVTSVDVSNVFGETLTIRRPNDDFVVYQPLCRDTQGPAGYLFVPPIARFREESAPVEEVRYLRDEVANMVWAVEHMVRNGLGEPVDGFDAQGERHARAMAAGGQPSTPGAEPAGQPAGEAPPPQYRLSTTVPDNWIPFIPVRIEGEGAAIYLHKARMVRNEEGQEPAQIDEMTTLLDSVRVNEEAVLRAGVKVQLTRQRVRWLDGKTYVWLGRAVHTGRGEGSSGLTFDVVK